MSFVGETFVYFVGLIWDDCNMAQYTVRWYSGRVLNERPVSLLMDGEEIDILKVRGEDLIEDQITGKRYRIFKVDTKNGRFNIYLDGESVEVKSDEHS